MAAIQLAFPLPGEGARLLWSILMEISNHEHAAVLSSVDSATLGQTPLSTLSVPHVSTLICDQGWEVAIEDIPFALMLSFIDERIWRHYSTNIPSTERCRIFKLLTEEPVPLGWYERKDLVEWNDILPAYATIRRQFPGPFEVWDWILDPDQYQSAVFDVKDEADDNFICGIFSEPIRQQKTLVLVDWQNEKILFASPGFFRHHRLKQH